MPIQQSLKCQELVWITWKSIEFTSLQYWFWSYPTLSIAIKVTGKTLLLISVSINLCDRPHQATATGLVYCMLCLLTFYSFVTLTSQAMSVQKWQHECKQLLIYSPRHINSHILTSSFQYQLQSSLSLPAFTQLVYNVTPD